jgi:hypothetical protein
LNFPRFPSTSRWFGSGCSACVLNSFFGPFKNNPASFS